MSEPPDMERLLHLAWHARRNADPVRALSLFRQAGQLARKSGNRTLLVRAMNGEAQIHRDEGRLNDALIEYERALAWCRNANEPLLLAHTLRHFADAMTEQDEWLAARPLYEEALAVYRNHAAADPVALANTLRSMALLLEHSQRHREATDMWQEARDIYNTSGIKAGADECRQAMLRCQVKIDS